MRVLAVIGVVLLLAGCVQTGTKDASTPAPSVTPVFASEEEALAAAEEAYAAYQAAADQALQSLTTGDLESVATGVALDGALKSIQSFVAKGQRQIGSSTIDTLSIARFDNTELQLYACLDLSTTDIVDAQGNSVLSEGRTVRYPLIVTLVVDANEKLLVESEEVWTGENFC